MDNNNTDTNNNNDDGGNIEREVPEGSTTLGHSASATGSTSSSSSSRPMSSLDHLKALVQSQEDEAVPHPDQGLILDIDGGISQSEQRRRDLSIRVGPGQTHRDRSEPRSDPGHDLRGQPAIFCRRQCLPLDGATEVRRVGRNATGHEPQWIIRQRRGGSKRCVHASLLPGDRRQRLERPEPGDSPADQLRRVFDGAKTDSDQTTGGSGGQRDIMPTIHLGVVGCSQWTHAIPPDSSRRGSTVLPRTL